MDSVTSSIGKPRLSKDALADREEEKSEISKRFKSTYDNFDDQPNSSIKALQSQLMFRQMKGRKADSMVSEAQRKMEVQCRLMNPTYNKEQRRKAEEARAKLTQEEEATTREFITEMDFANEEDWSKVSQGHKGKQAMHRFSLIPRLEQLMKKKPIQTQFLKFNGCVMLEKWLKLNPDGSLPPIQVIEAVFDVLDNLPIEIEHLQNSNIARVLQFYASGSSELGSAITQRATHLLQRWQVTVYQLNYNYDEEGLHELKHRQLKRKLEVVKNAEMKDFKLNSDQNQDTNTVTMKEDELIRKAPNGRFIMHKSCFDFLEKPVGYTETTEFQEQLAEDRTTAASSSVKVQYAGNKKGGKSALSAKGMIQASLTAQKKPKKTKDDSANLGFV